MIIYEDCDYYNDLIDNEFSPYPLQCESCYRYEICLEAYKKEFDERQNI